MVNNRHFEPRGDRFAQVVAGAWDFERINRRYTRHLKILEERPGNALGNVAAAKALLRWSATEREAWLDAVINDPLLPGRILPSDYLGQQAWRRRVEAPGRQPATAHVQTRIARCKTLLPLQQKFVVNG